jgi:hypothetical protein
MPLNGQQTKQFADALLNSCPRRADLKQLVLLGMDTNLDAIVGEGGLDRQIHELIVWAQAEGRLADLVASAVEARPNNPLVKQLATDFAAWTSPAQPGGA